MDSSPGFSTVKIIREAMRAVPATKFPLGVAGVGAAAAILLGLFQDPLIAVLAVVVLLGLMTVLLTFATLARSSHVQIRWLGLLMAWVFVSLTCASAILVFTITFFSWPQP